MFGIVCFFVGASACGAEESDSGGAAGGSGGTKATGGSAGATSSDGGGGVPTTDAGGGADGSADGSADSGTDGSDGSTPVETARCGLEFSWLPKSSVGAVTSSETPQSALTIAKAVLAQVVFQSQGLTLHRVPTHATLAHRIVYTTQDRGQSREATGLVVVPQVTQSKTFPMIVFHHGTTGLTDICAPSLDFEDSSTENYAVALLLSLISSYGYIVVAPDYLGQKSVGAPSPSLHPYLIGEPTAIAAWDAARAATQLLATDASQAEAGPVALWGASQGGHAAMFTALFHSAYAPEMDLRAGVYAVPPSDLQTHMTLGTRELRSSTGNVVLFYTAADAWYQPGVSPGLSEIFLSPLDTQVPQALATDCSPSTLDNVTSVDQVFTPGLIAASQTAALTGYEPWGCFLRENSVTTTSLPSNAVPGLFILGENDTLVSTDIERKAFDTLCSQGHKLSYLECAGAKHEEGFFWSIDTALDYIDDRIAGKAPTDVCKQTPAQKCSNTP